MALCKDTRLSSAEREYIAFIVENIPAGNLVSFAKSSASMKKGGFRSDRPQIVKSVIKSEIDSAQPIDGSLRSFLASNCECASITRLLSQSAIADCSRAIEFLFSKQEFRIARLLDARADVRDKAAAEEPSEEKKEYSDEDKTWARVQIAEYLAPLASSLPPFPAATATSGGGSPSPSSDKANFQTRSAQSKLAATERQLKGAQTKISDLEARHSKNEEAIRQLTTRAENAEGALGAMRNRAENAEAAVDRYRKNIENYTEAAVESRLAEEFTMWLGGKRLEQIRAVSPGGLSASSAGTEETSGSATVLSRAQAALNLQAREDFASGVRDILTEQLEKTSAMLGKCLAAQKNAITVVPELGSAIAELTAEKARLLKALGEDNGDASVLSPEDALDTAISAAEDQQLPDISHTAKRLREMGALSEEAHGRLKQKIDARYEAYYEKRAGTVLDSGDKASPEELLELGRQGRIPVTLLVDGHNVLFSLSSRYCRAQDHRGPSAEAREWLVGDLCRIFGNAPSVRVKLVFDGTEYSYQAIAPNIDLEYSGGGTSDVEHRADNVLAQAARSHRDSGCKSHLLIVTNDNGLANRVISNGGHSLPPTVFLKWL